MGSEMCIRDSLSLRFPFCTLADVFKEQPHLLVPELEFRDAADDLDVDVGVLFYLQEVVDVLLVEEGDVEASASCPSVLPALWMNA